MVKKEEKYILWFKDISYKDVPLVGGKNASLGEMFSQLSQKEIMVPNGFALTTNAYWHFIKHNKINVSLKEIFSKFDPKSIKSLQIAGKKARELFAKAIIPEDLKAEIFYTYKKLLNQYGRNSSVAVRSSGVAEDAPTASFAGQFESFLNIRNEKQLLKAIKKCMASTFNDRVISYRQERKISQLDFALSVGVQKMVRSDLACSGIMFTLDPQTGFRDLVVINSIWGLGEMIVKGKITPDEFYIFKPTLKTGFRPIISKKLARKTKKLIYSGNGGLKEAVVRKKDQVRFSLTDEEILRLSKWACEIEEHYQRPQDLEWAKDGETGKLFILQSRPETVHTSEQKNFYEKFEIKSTKLPVLTGIAIGSKIGQGSIKIISDISKISQFKKGDVLLTKMTDPDWVSIFPLASAIITEQGGPTCHAAIVSREMGIPCIVGAVGALKRLKNKDLVTVDCTQGRKGRIFMGKLHYKLQRYDLDKISKTKTKIMINIGAPEIAFKSSFLPNDGVGLAREEFIIAQKIKIHPLALYHYKKIKNQISRITDKKKKLEITKIIKKIDQIVVGSKDKREYFIKELSEGIAQIASAFYPKEVIVRFSDFKTNEYRNLIGGDLFETEESNPMIGFRGAARYLDESFQPAFEMECEALKRARNIFGLKNISLMVPFCRTVEEGRLTLELMKKFGLNIYLDGINNKEKVKNRVKVYVMCEIPSNVLLIEKFLDIFDGMSIGSNDLTQLVLGVDRDNAFLANKFDERDEAVKDMIRTTIRACKKRKKYCGICGQAPSDFPEFAKFLAREGIQSISLSSDAVIKTILALSSENNES